MSSRRCRFIENVERRLAVLKLEMTDISKSFFGVQVLHQVSLRVEKGTIHALIGENGAGKSTLMNILGGVYSLDNGIVKVDEKDVHDLTVRKAEALGIAFVHQEVNLFNDLLVYENIFMGKELTKHGLLNRKEMIQRTNALFADLHVDMKATDLVGTLSTGKKQLLEIAKACPTEERELGAFMRLLASSGLGRLLRPKAPRGPDGGQPPYDASSLLAAILFAFSDTGGTVRDVADSCRFDLRYRYLTSDAKPGKSTVAGFISRVIAPNADAIFRGVTGSIMSAMGGSPVGEVFVDGSKFEANANKYKFTFRSRKRALGLLARAGCLIRGNGMPFPEKPEPPYSRLIGEAVSEVGRRLSAAGKDPAGSPRGRGHRADPEVRLFRTLSALLGRMLAYEETDRICGPGRNSFYKTDRDATAMCLKEDYYSGAGSNMHAAYNVQIAVSSGIIVGYYVSQDRSDSRTLPAFLGRMRGMWGSYPAAVCADAGYGSAENYSFLAAAGISCYVKYKASLFILDEPTTALSNEEINNLFRIINELKAQGNTFIFISHKMPEIFRLCDDYTVLRNGEMVLSGHLKDTNPQEVTKAIVGEKYQNKEVYASRELGPVCLRLVNYSGEGFSNINLEVHQGEIIGFTGLHGSGSSELMQAMFGITKATSGEFIANQKSLTGASVKKVMQNHIGMVPANRKENSVFGDLNLLDNLCIADFSVEPGPLFHLRREEKQFGRYQDELAIKANSQKDLLLSLSGGNQQKVIIARWLKTNADILLLDNPTQGIDVGAKNEIYRLLIQLAQSGKTILFNTLEIPEIQKCADRCVVFYHGRIEAVLERNEISDEKVMMYATHANKVGGDKQ
jgi:ABC-type sugar transport system ATPase subunit/transposase